MPTAFAALETRLGASTLARLSNATALVLAGGASIDGIFTQRPVEANLGQGGMIARDVAFICAAAEAAAAGVEPGSGLQVTYQTTVALWEVDTVTPLNDGTGHAELVLKAPPP